jgi:hypothetical protein
MLHSHVWKQLATDNRGHFFFYNLRKIPKGTRRNQKVEIIYKTFNHYITPWTNQQYSEQIPALAHHQQYCLLSKAW